jgi:hypothetical protein
MRGKTFDAGAVTEGPGRSDPTPYSAGITQHWRNREERRGKDGNTALVINPEIGAQATSFRRTVPGRKVGPRRDGGRGGSRNQNG